MTADSEGSGDPVPKDGTAAPGDADGFAAADVAPSERAEPSADKDGADAAEDLKAKYREALAHKQGSHGATQNDHGDKGAGPHGPEQAHGHRMFRRKSGG